MALSQYVLLFGAVLAIVVPMTTGCATEIMECSKKMQASMGMSGDLTAMCRGIREAKTCFMNLEGKCEGAMADTLKTSIDALEQSLQACGGSGGGSGGSGGSSSGSNGDSKKTCTIQDYLACDKKATKDDICPAYRCAVQLNKECDNDIFDNLPDAAKEAFNQAKEKCGCANLRPSILALLVSAIIFVFRSYF